MAVFDPQNNTYMNGTFYDYEDDILSDLLTRQFLEGRNAGEAKNLAHRAMQASKKLIEMHGAILYGQLEKPIHTTTQREDTALAASAFALAAPEWFNLEKYVETVAKTIGCKRKAQGYLLEGMEFWSGIHTQLTTEHLVHWKRSFLPSPLAENIDMIKEYLPEQTTQTILESLKGSDHHLPIYSRLSRDCLPEEYLREVDAQYHDVIHTNQIRTLRRNPLTAHVDLNEEWQHEAILKNRCEHTTRTLGSREVEYMNACFLAIDGEIVASLKLHEEPTVLGLRNVIDYQNKMPLVTNGLYLTTDDVIEQAQNKKGQILELEQLDLYPVRYPRAEIEPMLRAIIYS